MIAPTPAAEIVLSRAGISVTVKVGDVVPMTDGTTWCVYEAKRVFGDDVLGVRAMGRPMYFKLDGQPVRGGDYCPAIDLAALAAAQVAAPGAMTAIAPLGPPIEQRGRMKDTAGAWNCPHCHRWMTEDRMSDSEHFMTCDGCDVSGPRMPTRQGSIDAWNAMAAPALSAEQVHGLVEGWQLKADAMRRDSSYRTGFSINELRMQAAGMDFCAAALLVALDAQKTGGKDG